MYKFLNLKNYINSIKNNGFISRKDLINNVSNSIDSYRRCLTLLGYLQDTEKQGVYKKIKNIPYSLTSSKLKFAYKNNRFSFKNNYETYNRKRR